VTGPPPPELPSAVVRRPVPRLAAVVQLARPHQWSKNLLLLLPAFAGHMTWTLEHTVIVFQGFMAFSLVSSAGYIVNDL
jgi:4-hydroxybenzoate polyprenyltransferase